MTTTLEVALTPAEFSAIKARDLSDTTCVVFDILRATTSMTVALAHAAAGIIPVSEIPEALAVYERDKTVLLAGERHGLRILQKQTGSVDFNFGNSPREFVTDSVAGKTIVATTTNGTRALDACRAAKATLIASFLNLGAVGKWIEVNKPENLLLVCAGTFEEAAYEDILAAGALIDSIWAHYSGGKVTDSTHLAHQAFQLTGGDLMKSMQWARNARHLLSVPELRDDVPFCLQRDIYNFVAAMNASGEIRRIQN